MLAGRTIRLSYLVVFVASACTMVIELVAARMMALMVGVSPYTWTGIIGVVLAGMSLGNYLGGRIADPPPRSQPPGTLLLLSALSCLGVLAALNGLAAWPAALHAPLLGRIMLLTAILFFLPSCPLGTVSPAVVRLALKELSTTGSTAGRVYAFSTLGSILGTFATGFVLISWFGTRVVIGRIAVLLAVMGLVWRPSSTSPRPGSWRAPCSSATADTPFPGTWSSSAPPGAWR